MMRLHWFMVGGAANAACNIFLNGPERVAHNMQSWGMPDGAGEITWLASPPMLAVLLLYLAFASFTCRDKEDGR